MNAVQLTRRRFLADTTRIGTAGWLALLQIPLAETFASCARDDAPFANLTSAEGKTMRAFATRIIPPGNGVPGADDAGAVHFIDRALAAPFFAADVPVVRAGLADLDRRARVVGERGGFASLTTTQQIAILREIEHGDFFAAARRLVIIGTFADASYGGNRGGAGYVIAGIDHRGSYTAPFGWYDAAPNVASAGLP